MGKIIGLTYNLKEDWSVDQNEPSDANAEFDKPQTIERVEKALEAGGHTVKRIGDAQALLKQIDQVNVDIIFNLCEGKKGRNRESEVPVLLEMNNIPFVGADGLTLAMALDKIIAKKIFIAEQIPTPRFFAAGPDDDLDKLNTIGFPLIVKTSQEGSSKGISGKSKVSDKEALVKQVNYINETYNQPALVEELIRGTEFTVAVLGNKESQAMPVVQTTIDGKYDLGDEIYTNERIYSTSVEYICPAKIPNSLSKVIQELSVKVYKAVGCRDFGRIDFRVDESGNPYVLEINPLPSLDEEDVFNIFPNVLGSNYDETLNKVVDFALERYGLMDEDSKLIQSAEVF